TAHREIPLQSILRSLHASTKAVLFILLASLFFIACKKELKAPEPAPLDTGVLSASKDTVNINAANPGGEAVTISWTAAANSMITYKMRLSAGGKTDTVAIAQNSVRKRFTNAELNSILVDKLKLPVGELASVTVTVDALVPANGKTASSNSITLKAKPAATGPAYAKLWVVGDATPNGWDINNPNQMKQDPTNVFQFKYNEVLKAGEFKIPVATGNWGTDYFMPPANNPAITSTAVQLIAGGQPDNKWRITNPGPYKILLNISSSPSIKITPFTPYPALWMVGDATAAGWNIDAPVAMVPTAGNPYEFTYTGALKAGEFKIPVATGNWGTDYFMPPVNGAGINETNAIFIKAGNPDNKWKITEAGNYKVTVNQLYETISIVKQ
ncbi:MAG: SusF/SusE family outer membrane protein, partial [Bacteroidota bacterium]|nr:SusF/SusE family outer membrane protein [Bacteroidota bacterium]